jgi:hypothetical protein
VPSKQSFIARGEAGRKFVGRCAGVSVRTVRVGRR